MALDAAIADIRAGNAGDVPDHLRDSHYKEAEALNRGVGYQYPHNFDDAWVDQQYLPDKIKQAHYYQPKATGKYEQALGQRYQQLQQRKNRPNPQQPLHGSEKVLSPFSIFFIATFVVLCYYEGGNSVMYELSHLCVDRTFY